MLLMPYLQMRCSRCISRTKNSYVFAVSTLTLCAGGRAGLSGAQGGAAAAPVGSGHMHPGGSPRLHCAQPLPQAARCCAAHPGSLQRPHRQKCGCRPQASLSTLRFIYSEQHGSANPDAMLLKGSCTDCAHMAVRSWDSCSRQCKRFGDSTTQRFCCIAGSTKRPCRYRQPGAGGWHGGITSRRGGTSLPSRCAQILASHNAVQCGSRGLDRLLILGRLC